MIAGDDPTPWMLLHDGRLVAIRRTTGHAWLTVEIPHLRSRFDPPSDAIVVELRGLSRLGYLPYSDRWDEPLITELAAIVAERPTVADVEHRAALGDEPAQMIVWGSLGSLRLSYTQLELALADGRPCSIAALREAVAGFWHDWRERWQGNEVHPRVREAARERWTATLLATLIEAWRSERTTDLAGAIAIVDEALRGPVAISPVDADDVDRWCASYTEQPGAALAELGERARASWDLLLDRRLDVDEGLRRNAERWQQFSRCLAALATAAPDPRIGRAIEAMLRGPSDHWFRVDQVSHAIGQFEPPDDRPSFADHALALLDVHGDAGSPARLREQSGRLLIEADCNTAEMSRRLAALADRLADRWPRDRPLPDAVEQALRHR